jgi:CTP synthase (UTP-ammonia lyase)
VLGIAEADHAETASGVAKLVVNRLTCSLVEKSGIVRFVKGSTLQRAYGADESVEQYHCNFGLNPVFAALFDDPNGLHVNARDEAGEVRGVELAGHPFFVATLFQHERAGLKSQESPLVTAFLKAAQST